MDQTLKILFALTIEHFREVYSFFINNKKLLPVEHFDIYTNQIWTKL